jgi:hypothetical protein
MRSIMTICGLSSALPGPACLEGEQGPAGNIVPKTGVRHLGSCFNPRAPADMHRQGRLHSNHGPACPTPFAIFLASSTSNSSR